jgi:hypothetical protein
MLKHSQPSTQETRTIQDLKFYEIEAYPENPPNYEANIIPTTNPPWKL